MKKQLLFFNLMLRKGMIAFALLLFTLTVNTAAIASGNIDPPGHLVSKGKAVPAAVTTSAATNIGAVSAKLGGVPSTDPAYDFQQTGIVWALTANPTISDNKTPISFGSGSFSTVIKNLPSGTLIHFRSYAYDIWDDVLYGDDLTFTTLPALSVSVASQTNIACNGGNTGSAKVAASGGVTPYTYSWSPSGGSTATASSLTAATYICTVTDGEGTVKTQNFNISQPTALTANASKTDVSCNGGANGTATVVASGGTGALMYSWAPSGGTAATATGLGVGVYTCTITDANACSITRSVTITQPTAMSAVTSKTNVSCNGGGNGTATIVPSGGVGPYTYSWAPSGGTAATATGLVVGNYTVTVTDANTCTITRGFTITQPTAINVTTSRTDLACNGGSTGSASVNVTGGTPPYTYSWAPSGGTAATASGLAVGTYTCTITDANSCQATRSFTITQPTALVVTPGSQTNVACNGGTNGSATVSVSGGTPGYSYSWSPSGGTAATATGLAAGTYVCTVTDANTCTKTQSFTITAPNAITATTSQTNLSCNGGANGTATVIASGGTGALIYSWAPSGGTAATATGLGVGTYTCTITDANACSITRSVTITQPTAITATTASSNVSCNGGTNGTASVVPAGGVGPYTYSWAPSGGTAATATGLAVGVYTCTITDANGCTATRSITITQPTAITAATSQTNVACNGGTNGVAAVTASGGVGPYTYSWAPSGGTAAAATGLAAGTYTCTITDANACQITRSVTITQPTALTATTSQTNVACNGGTNGVAAVTASGGTGPYSYSWAPSGGTAAAATGLAAGTYTCTITDANACQTTRSVTITQPTALTATTSQTNLSCNGGANGIATVIPSGGTGAYTYSWAPSGGTAATATGLGVGVYTCTITDANACQTTRTVTITQPVVITTTGSQTNIACNGSSTGIATVTATGGVAPYSYSWAPSGGTAATASGLAAGTYTVTVTDANACTKTRTFTITQPFSAITATTAQTNVVCNGGANGTATVNPSGGTPGYTYSWSPSGGTAATATGLTPGVYNCTITDANACQITKSVTITQPTAITATTAQTNVSCNGGSNGSATVTVSGGAGGYTYSWSPTGGAAATASGLTAGTYVCTITDENGCATNQTVTLTQPSPITVTTAQTNVSCNGGSNGSATVTTSGSGYTYVWSPSGGTAATATGLTAGVYTCTITDENGCTLAKTFTLTQPSAIAATISQINIACNGGSNGSATVSNVTGGTGPYTYAWAPSGGTAATASGLAAGTYTCTITDANACYITKSVTITQPAAITATTAQTNTSCNGGSNGSATVTVSGGTGTYTYAWAPSGGTAATASGLAAGTYTCTITDANACSITRTITITQPNALTATTTQTNLACNGGANGSASVTVSGGTGTYTYSWSPTGGAAATASGLAAGSYTCMITDANGCFTTKTFSITQPSALTATTAQTNLACNGGANGSASVTVTGGTGTYTYAWAPSGGTAASASGLAAGTYTCTITDANGCAITRTITVTQPSALTATTAQTNLFCNGGSNGSATVTVSGGTGTYTYSWAPSGGTAATASGLAAGTYTCTITDANLCSTTKTFTITQPSLISVTPSQVNVTTVGGSNGSATVTVTGGTGTYTYSWSPSGGTAATASGLVAGSYTCTITDANGCTATKTFSITQPAALTGFQNINKNYGDPTFPLTNPNSASAGAFSYSSSNSSIASVSGANVTILTPGTVTITATQAASGNYGISTTTATLTVAKKDISLTLNPAPAISKTYDGNTNITLAPANYSLTGLVTGDVLSVTATTTYQNSSAAVGKTITANNFVLSGTQKDYYNLTTATANVTGSITPKTLTATATTVSKVYDGTDVANLSFNPLTGIITGDVVTLVQGTAAYDNKNVGIAKPITTTGLTINGASAANYTLAPVALTGTITAKPLTITADNKEKFMGTANPVFTASYTGFVSGESNSVLTTQPVLTTSATLSSPIGTYDINVAGAAATNYSITYLKGIFTVKPGAPKSIALAGVTLFEYSPAGTNAGTLSSTSDDPQAIFTYSLVSGAGDIDNSSFSIVGNNIQTAKSLSMVTKTNYSVLVRSTTQHGLSLEKFFTINLTAATAKATNIMSPNGDGVNDKWVIDDLQLYPNNEVKIFDRTGRTVYSKKGYDNSWEGTLNGAPLAEGTYYYVIDFGPDRPKTKGYITITRPK